MKVVLVALVVTVAVAAPVGAQSRGTGSLNRAESVVLTELQARDAKLREVVDGGLKPAVDDLKKSLSEGVAAARAALEAAKQDPNEEKVNAYNQVIADVYSRVAAGLDAIREQRTAVTKAAADVTSAVERTRKQFDATLLALQRDAERRRTDTERRRLELEALAAKYAARSPNGEPANIPADIELKIRELAVLHDLGAAQANVLRQGHERLAQWQAKLDQQAGALARLQQDVQLVFTRADASVALVSDVAAARKTELQIGAVVSRVARLTTDLASAHGAIDTFNADMFELLAQPPAVDADAVATVTPAPVNQSALEILKRFVKAENHGGTR